MQIQSLGHVVIRVSNQARAEAFYNGILGLPIVARMESREMTFFSLGNHHDFAIAAIGDDAPKADKATVGLAHVAFKIGDDLEALREAKAHLEASGVEIHRTAEHIVSKSIYFHDPDGNQLEVFVDADPAVWHENPGLVATRQPLNL